MFMRRNFSWVLYFMIMAVLLFMPAAPVAANTNTGNVCSECLLSGRVTCRICEGVGCFLCTTGIGDSGWCQICEGYIFRANVLFSLYDVNRSFNSDGFVIDSDGMLTRYASSNPHVVIPDGVKGIGTNFLRHRVESTRLFSQIINITSVTIPSSVEAIFGKAFSGNVSLKTVTFAPGVKYIGNGAFESCISLDNVVLPETVVEIGSGAFSRCSRLTMIAIPPSVKIFVESRPNSRAGTHA